MPAFRTRLTDRQTDTLIGPIPLEVKWHLAERPGIARLLPAVFNPLLIPSGRASKYTSRSDSPVHRGASSQMEGPEDRLKASCLREGYRKGLEKGVLYEIGRTRFGVLRAGNRRSGPIVRRGLRLPGFREWQRDSGVSTTGAATTDHGGSAWRKPRGVQACPGPGGVRGCRASHLPDRIQKRCDPPSGPVLGQREHSILFVSGP